MTPSDKRANGFSALIPSTEDNAFIFYPLNAGYDGCVKTGNIIN
jgi:hypothetical protein